MDFLARDLRVMDSTAVTMCKEHDVPIVVFDMTEPGTIVRAVLGEKIGTIVQKGVGQERRLAGHEATDGPAASVGGP
jgi:uridylate kinase